jgi:hypothetical protein
MLAGWKTLDSVPIITRSERIRPTVISFAFHESLELVEEYTSASYPLVYKF